MMLGNTLVFAGKTKLDSDQVETNGDNQTRRRWRVAFVNTHPIQY